jgi:hypothetical protein
MTEPAIPAIDGRAGFIAALRWAFGTAFEQGARRIVCCDAAFADWPLDDPALLQGLTTWLKRPQRRLVLLARSYDEVPRRCPRFTAWRNDWAHAIEAWIAPEEMAADLPTVLVSDGAVCVHLIDALHWRGRAELDERRARQWCEELDVVLQRSERGFGVNTLGL